MSGQLRPKSPLAETCHIRPKSGQGSHNFGEVRPISTNLAWTQAVSCRFRLSSGRHQPISIDFGLGSTKLDPNRPAPAPIDQFWSHIGHVWRPWPKATKTVGPNSTKLDPNSGKLGEFGPRLKNIDRQWPGTDQTRRLGIDQSWPDCGQTRADFDHSCSDFGLLWATGGGRTTSILERVLSSPVSHWPTSPGPT